jgi:protein-S-isoprenylcysteine O-methyltransferase Ste14
MNAELSLYIYLCGVVLAYLVRIPFVKQANRGAIQEDRVDFREGLYNILSFLGMFVAPFFDLGKSFASLDYTAPAWLSWVGTVVLAAGILLLWRAHLDLGRSWSATVRIRAGHALVTQGVYAWVRHPIYAAHWLIALSQALLVHNWLLGLIGLPAFAMIFFYRLPREEAMMLKTYGEEYRAYMQRVGGVVPKILGET